MSAPAAAAAQDSLAEGQWWQDQWDMEEVWRISDGTGVTVAVLDSGMDPSVPELAGAVLPGTDLVGADANEADHGTGMAALIAGHGGSSGFRGVAPGASILPVIVGNPELQSEVAFDIMSQGIRYATDNNAQVINISQAGTGYLGQECPDPITDAVRYAADNDVIVVAGSGNDAGGPSPYPGNCPGVLTVGATDRQLNPWMDSHRSEHVDVTAAGVEISTLGRGGQAVGGSGTSSATALVSGAIALVRAEFPDATADEVLRRIIYTAGDIHTSGRDTATGYGVVQPIHALTEELPPDAPNPVYEQLYGAEQPANPTPGPLQTGGVVLEPGPEASGERGDAIYRWLAIGIVAVFAALVVVGLVVALTVGRRRRPTQPGPYPYPPRPVPPPPPPGRPHR